MSLAPMGCNPISVLTDIGGPFIHYAYRQSKKQDYMYLLLIVLPFDYFCFLFFSTLILLREFILKYVINLLHPFDFECVAHGMTFCMGFEC